MSELIRCPYCGEHGFDLVGLKIHFEMRFCEKYETVDIDYPTGRTNRLRGQTP